MLIFPVAAADIAPLIDNAQHVVLIQSASVSAPPLLDRLRQARNRDVQVNALLGPKPDVEIVDGKPMVGTRPYALHAGAELDALCNMGVEYLINPAFNELNATKLQPGAASHASYLVSDSKVALICTGPFSGLTLKRERNVCIGQDQPDVVKALVALFYSEFDDALSAAQRADFDRVARSRLIVCPDCEAALLAELADTDELILRVAGFGTLPKIKARLLELGPRLRVLLPAAYRGLHPLETSLRQSGAQVRFVVEPFDGIVWAGRSKSGAIRAFVGSMQLNVNSLTRSREVGFSIPGSLGAEVRSLLNDLWSEAR
jgi:hypothetical protein